MNLRHSLASLALLALCGASPATAQEIDFTGQWGCMINYVELDQMGNRKPGGWSKEFGMAVYANGAYEAGGTEAAIDGIGQFRTQGQWQAAETQFMAQGPEESSKNMMGLALRFAFFGTLAPDGRSMATTYEQPDPNGQYVMSRSNYYCERRG